MIIEPTVRGTWIAHGRAGGIPFVAEGETRDQAFRAALDAIYCGAACRKLAALSGQERPTTPQEPRSFPTQ